MLFSITGLSCHANLALRPGSNRPDGPSSRFVRLEYEGVP
jgi:hypothetical protein